MKKHFSRVIALLLIAMAVTYGASAQIYVKIRPTHAVVVRPVAPSPAHVWIDEEWEPRGGTYVYTGGHWAAPPHPGWAWIPGHWRHEGRGEIWIRGHWRRR